MLAKESGEVQMPWGCASQLKTGDIHTDAPFLDMPMPISKINPVGGRLVEGSKEVRDIHVDMI